VVVGGYRYTPACTITVSGSTTSVVTALRITPLTGQTYNVYGLSDFQSNDTGAITPALSNFHALTGTQQYPTAGNNALQRQYMFITLTDDTGNVQQLTFRISANGSGALAANEFRCMIEGAAVPTTS
jgi:hypothetical protein